MEDTANGWLVVTTGFGKLRGVGKGGRRDLLLRYSRKVICANTRTGEE